MIILSPKSVESENVLDEVAFAINEGKQIITVLFQVCKIPFRLSRKQYIDFTKDYEAGLRDLLKVLNIGIS